MNGNHDTAANRAHKSMRVLAGLALAFTILVFAPAVRAQPAEPKADEPKTMEVKAMEPTTAETFYLVHLTSTIEMQDVQTDLRNMVPRAKIYGVPSQHAISIKATAEDMALARKMIADLDRPRKTYRLTYTITQSENGKRVGEQKYALLLVSGEKSSLKQGQRAPIVTGTSDAGSGGPTTQVQYVDLGLSIDATVEENQDGARLITKVEQSALADEKSGMGAQNQMDPVIQQTTLEGTSTLVQGKPMVLGSLDVPGSGRHQEIAVVSELVR